MKNGATWLDEIASLNLSGNSEDAFRCLYQTVDAMSRAGEFAAVDEVLRTLDLDRFDTALLLGFLTITGAVRTELAERAGLYQRIKERLEKTDPTRVDILLEGLG